MSKAGKMNKVTTSVIRTMKEKGEKVTMLTAYDYSTAAVMDEAGVDMILIGDSLGMVPSQFINLEDIRFREKMTKQPGE